MPIYMDFHDLPEINVEDSHEAHLRDLAVQEKYKVKYHQYWINEKDGKAYCLIEGPSKEACEATHREANGIKACNLVEIKKGMYDLFLGDNQQIDHGLVRHINGEIDNGYRFIMSLKLIAPVKEPTNRERFQKSFDQLKLECIGIIEKFQGRDMDHLNNHIIGVFMTPGAALNSSIDLRKHLHSTLLKRRYKNVKFKIGICVGQPVTAAQGFFEEAINFSEILCDISKSSKITSSRSFADFSNLEHNQDLKKKYRVVEDRDGKFLSKLYDFTKENLDNHELNVKSLCESMGVSRAQLYRKTTNLTGFSPNNFIRNIRLKKAFELLKKGGANISETSLDVGFNNASYFTKCFQKKYGVSPSKIK
ncbi:DUF4242 domain-containing protein [Lutimonas saemankumensis]|uniref:nickel-binding protein n=1 Tax=Lutimonas saemankumensis TaxID=483016 RepID=UPI001CD4C439|nr:nickel-binding protein [Lutimonas saemankumensis]MCA0933567.1 DUF4242 domain-containing protein [Lutimonas saemankumensis]